MLQYTLYILILISSWYYQSYFLYIFTKNIYNLFYINFIIYWLLGGIYIYLDYYKISFIEKYKIHNINKNISFKNILSTILPTILLNHIISFTVFILYNLYTNKGLLIYSSSLSLLTLECSLFFILFDIIFYIGHRIIHFPILYKYIHKTHHNINANIAISGYYMGVIDYFIEFMFPLYISSYILNTNILVLFICSTIGQINGLISHSAYDFPFLPYKKDHLYHHLELHCNYGVIFTDYLFKTKKK
jgi:fatty acid hydroxylase domain-containing protein 2